MNRGLFNRSPRDRIQNELTEAINNDPNLSLIRLLEIESLGTSLRNEVPELVSFLYQQGQTDQPVLAELIEWALTNKYQVESYRLHQKFDPKSSEVTQCFAYSRNASQILSSVSKKLQEVLDADRRLYFAVIEFVPRDKAEIEQRNLLLREKEQQLAIDLGIENVKLTPAYLDESIVGNFLRITETVIRFTKGAILNSLVNREFLKFLCNNIGVLGYRDLLLSLATDFSTYFALATTKEKGKECREFIVHRAIYQLKHVMGKNSIHRAYSILSLLLSIVQNNDECIGIFFDDSAKLLQELLTFISSFIAANSNMQPQLLINSVCKLCHFLLENAPDPTQNVSILTSFVDQIGFASRELTLPVLLTFPFFALIPLPTTQVTPLELLLDYFFVDTSLRPVTPLAVPMVSDAIAVIEAPVDNNAGEIQIKDWQKEKWSMDPIPANQPCQHPNGSPIRQSNTIFCRAWLKAFKSLSVEHQKEFCVRNNLLARSLDCLALPPTVRNLRMYKTMGVATNGFVLKFFKRISKFIDYPEDPVYQEKWLIVTHRYIRNTLKMTLKHNRQLDKDDLDEA